MKDRGRGEGQRGTALRDQERRFLCRLDREDGPTRRGTVQKRGEQRRAKRPTRSGGQFELLVHESQQLLPTGEVKVASQGT